MSRWNQPICGICWAERNPEREPTRLVAEWREVETCSYCGQQTQSGIYVRDNPANVSFPPEEVPA